MGRKLSLDVYRILQYDIKERHQRLIEMWFEQECEPSREKLSDAVFSRKESSVGVSSDPKPSTPDLPRGKTIDMKLY